MLLEETRGVCLRRPRPSWRGGPAERAWRAGQPPEVPPPCLRRPVGEVEVSGVGPLGCFQELLDKSFWPIFKVGKTVVVTGRVVKFLDTIFFPAEIAR